MRARFDWRYVLSSAGFLGLHLLLATIGVAMWEHAAWKWFPTHSRFELFRKEYVLGAAIAFAIGFGIPKRLRGAQYLWVPLTCWFAVGIVIALMAPDNYLSLRADFSGAACAARGNVQSCNHFVRFTVPAWRAVCYSLGAAAGGAVYPHWQRFYTEWMSGAP